MQVVFYDEDPSGDKLLVYADILSAYVTPQGEPFIEHGYLWDKDDLQRDPACSKFLSELDRPIGERELINSLGVYHTHAGCIEGLVYLYRGSTASCLPSEHSDQEFFWDRAIDLEMGERVPATAVTKTRLL